MEFNGTTYVFSNYSFSLQEYTFPTYPKIYEQEKKFWTLSNISHNLGVNLTKLTFTFYDDPECYLQTTHENKQQICYDIGVCSPRDSKEVNATELFQMWVMSEDDQGTNNMIWIDYFNFFGYCDYNEHNVIANGPKGGVLFQDEIRIGTCQKTKGLFEEKYVLVYLGCGGEDFVKFFESQKESLQTGGIVIGVFIVLIIMTIVVFSVVQMIFLSVIDVYHLPVFQKKKKKIAKIEEGDELDDVKIEKKKEEGTTEISDVKIEEEKVEETTDRVDEMKIEEKIDLEPSFSKEKLIDPVAEDSIVEDRVPDVGFWEKIKQLTVYKNFFLAHGGMSFDYELHFPEKESTLKSRIWVTIRDTLFSIGIIVSLEVTTAFSLWFSIICFLNGDISKSDPKYIQKNHIYSNYENMLLIVFAIYLIIEILFVIIWVNRHIIQPVKVMIILPCYREWLVYRIFKCCIIFFYLFYGIQAFISTNNDIIMEHYYSFRAVDADPKMSFLSQLFLSAGYRSIFLFWLALVSSIVLLVLDFFNSLSYDGYSSINFYHRMNDAASISKMSKVFPWIKGYFPDVKWSWGWLFSSPDEIIHDLITILSLCEECDGFSIEDIDEGKTEKMKEEMNILSKSIDFGNYPFDMISDLEGKQIKFLKYFIFGLGNIDMCQKKSEEQFYDVIMYTSPLSLDWFKALLFYSCVKYRKMKKKDAKDSWGILRKESVIFKKEDLTNKIKETFKKAEEINDMVFLESVNNKSTNLRAFFHFPHRRIFGSLFC